MDIEMIRIGYELLEKPSFAPESWVFTLAWGLIYPMIFVAFSLAIYSAVRKKISQTIYLPLMLNLVFNLSFTHIQFTLQNNILATMWIIIVLLSLAWIMYFLWPKQKIAFFLLIPYAVWASFATILQITITIINL
ncbi:MAG: TspO/MBR family protein [Patescibacteria group bacterium]